MDTIRKILVFIIFILNVISFTFISCGIYVLCIKQPLDNLVLAFYISIIIVLCELLIFICFIIRVLYNRYNFYKQIDERTALITDDV